MQIPSIDWGAFSPEITICSLALVILFLDLFLPKEKRFVLGYLSLLGILMGLVLVIGLFSRGIQISTLADMFIADRFASFLKVIFLLTAALTILISFRYTKLFGIDQGEYYELILFATLGMMIMASAADLLTVYLGLELMAISLYILAGFQQDSLRSSEAAIKFFLLGAFASAILLFGIAMIYGATGTTNIARIAQTLQSGVPSDQMVYLSIVMLTAGMAYKVAAVPFHMWAPDVYEGAPTPITAFMSVAPKVAGYAIIVRVFMEALQSFKADWMILFWVLSILTMTFGNVLAIAQKNLKRMFAYSSIAHTGYLLIAVAAYAQTSQPQVTQDAISAILVYAVAYMLMNVGVFAVIIFMANSESTNEELDDFAGLATRKPGMAAMLSILLLSLTGIPPTLGFIGKFLIFKAAISAGLVGLALIGLLNTAIAAYFYFRIMIYMYMRDPVREIRFEPAQYALVITVIILAVFTLLLGIQPGYITEAASKAAAALPIY